MERASPGLFWGVVRLQQLGEVRGAGQGFLVRLTKRLAASAQAGTACPSTLSDAHGKAQRAPELQGILAPISCSFGLLRPPEA